jgi:hypothetical protein
MFNGPKNQRSEKILRDRTRVRDSFEECFNL